MTSTASIPQRKIGDVEVGAIGYGAMGISAFYGKTLPDEERFKVRIPPLWKGSGMVIDVHELR